MTISRRELFGTAAAIASAAAFDLHADPLGMPIGTQTYPFRDRIQKDFEGTLKEVAALGYKSIELCSPFSYQREFGALAKVKPADLKKTIESHGLKCESCHFGMKEARESLDERIPWAKELGLKQMIVASFGLRNDAVLSDWTKAAEDLNKAGEKAQKSGIQTGYHNHDGEFRQLEGTLIYDHLMKTLDPKSVKMQFQVSVISLGYHAADFMEKYPGRFISLHLQDWSAVEKKQVPVGQGSVDWKHLFGAAKRGGVKNYFVEMNWDAMKPSYEYLHSLKV